MAGCATGIDNTLKMVKQDCDQVGGTVTILISNTGGTESMRAKCTWLVEEVPF
jgi:hypothetical protein